MTTETPPADRDALAQIPSPPEITAAERLTVTETGESEAEPDPLIGQIVGERYHVTHLIGTGGMGAVYGAEHIHMQKAVALKVLHREMTVLPEVVKRFEREAIAAGRIEHPNVVQARDFGRLKDGAFYLVLEYVEGTTLSEALSDGPFSTERTLSVVGQIAEALGAAHERGIVHRDLKPDNIMLVGVSDAPELVKVLDFGIAKVDVLERGESKQPITKIGTVFGTPEYMSPEQAAGQPVDHRGDLYALGVLMYRMLAGSLPFVSEEVNAVLMMQITQSPPPLSEAVPRGVRELVTDLLRKQPGDRLQTTSEVLDRVLALVGEQVSAHSRTRARIASAAMVEERASLVDRLDASRVGRRISVLGARIPMWRLAALGVFLCGLGAALAWMLTPTDSSAGLAEPAPSVATPTAPLAPEFEKLVAKASVGTPEAVAELAKRSPKDRSVRVWLALGRGFVKLQRHEEALKAFEVVLRERPAAGQDPALRRDVWALSKETATAEGAMNLAAAHFGSQGGDLLYKIWVDTKEVTPSTSLAKSLVYSEAVRSNASPALTFLLDWRKASGCEEYGRLLPRAAMVADHRAVTLLQRLLNTGECGFPKDTLEAAVSAVKDRPEPTPY